MPRRSERNLITNALQRESLLSASFLLVLFAVLSKIFGLIREVVIAAKYGASTDVDAFFVAVSIPGIAGMTIGAALGTALVPHYFRIKSDKGEAIANQLIRAVTSFNLVISVGLALLLIVFAGDVIGLVAPSLPAPTQEKAGELLVWLSILVVALSFNHIVSAVYHVHAHFKTPAYMDFIGNVLVVVIVLGFSSILGIRALVFGVVFGVGISTAVLYLHLRKLSLIGASFGLFTVEFRQLAFFAVPIALYSLFTQCVLLVENYFAASLSEGSVAAYGYAKRLYDVLPTLVVASISKTIFPLVSELVSAGEIRKLVRWVEVIMRVFLIVFVPASVFLGYFSQEIMEIVFMRGQFTRDAATAAAAAFMFLIPGLVAYAIIAILLKVCYAYGDNRTPLIGAFFALTVMVLFNLSVVEYLGIRGIALGNTLFAFVYVIFLGFFFSYRTGGVGLGPVAKVGIYSILSALAAGVPVALAGQRGGIALLVFFPCYLLLYFILCRVLMRQDVYFLLGLLASALGRGDKRFDINKNA